MLSHRNRFIPGTGHNKILAVPSSAHMIGGGSTSVGESARRGECVSSEEAEETTEVDMPTITTAEELLEQTSAALEAAAEQEIYFKKIIRGTIERL